PVLTAEEIRNLSQQFEIGAHTVHHAVLTEIPESEAEIEIRESRAKLQDITGTHCDTFCFPRGRFRPEHLDMVRRAGFRSARTLEFCPPHFPADREGLRLIPTTVQASTHNWMAYARNSIKRWNPRNLHLLLQARSQDWVQMAHLLLQQVAERG